MSSQRYDIVVIGGGHAGIEACSAAARMGARTVLITLDRTAIGRLSCNPAIGGMAKGQMACEIDALGGEMGRLADRSGIQFKTLGRSKGPAMWSPRSQNDKDLYPRYALELLESIDGLTIIEGMVENVVLEGGKVAAVQLSGGSTLYCSAVVLCSGTFLCGRMHTGESLTIGGRVGEHSAESLSGSLREVGFSTGRLKTGTPPRIHRESIDFSSCERDSGDPNPRPFSKRTKEVSNRIDCYMTHTSEETHEILRTGFDRSPMFTGRITGVGPRYCPSIEDKIYRFADKESHQIFLEPEGLETDSVYVNGFSTSLPDEVQLAALRTIPGLEQCEILRLGYAVEYDFFPPHQLRHTMESKLVHNLFFAGQVNGTSGYEEAAAQGLMAGINAVLKIRGEEPFVLDRAEAYIGVLIDDLINLSTNEPYRMFTSRAEYRLLLRRDNADIRLTERGHVLGLVEAGEIDRVRRKVADYKIARSLLESTSLTATDDLSLPDHMRGIGTVNGWSLLRRPEVTLSDLRLLANPGDEWVRLSQRADIEEQLEVNAKYEGYIQRQLAEVEKFRRSESAMIPGTIDYAQIKSLSSEAREKLDSIRPGSLGQASRISGVTRADLAILMLYIR